MPVRQWQRQSASEGKTKARDRKVPDMGLGRSLSFVCIQTLAHCRRTVASQTSCLGEKQSSHLEGLWLILRCPLHINPFTEERPSTRCGLGGRWVGVKVSVFRLIVSLLATGGKNANAQKAGTKEKSATEHGSCAYTGGDVGPH
eukprot:2892320-Amphidinium_carterae.3